MPVQILSPGLHGAVLSLWTACLLAPVAASGPSTQDAATPSGPVAHIPDVVVVAPRRADCTQDDASGVRSVDYACLNRSLEGEARPPVHRGAAAPVDLTSPERTGTFSYSAVSQRMGANFGRAATPQRPQTPTYSNAIPGGPR